MTRWQALGYVAAFAGGAAISEARRRPEVRIEKTRETKQERAGEAKVEAKRESTADAEKRSQERTQERIETRKPDGTVRVVYRDRVKHAEAKERVVTKIEVKEVVKWQTKVEYREKLVETKPAPQKLPRWSVAAGPAFTPATGLARPGGFALTAGVRAIGPLWLHLQGMRIGKETTVSALLGWTF